MSEKITKFIVGTIITIVAFMAAIAVVAAAKFAFATYLGLGMSEVIAVLILLLIVKKDI